MFLRSFVGLKMSQPNFFLALKGFVILQAFELQVFRPGSKKFLENVGKSQR
jgi:hypothetical protein